MQKNNLKTKDNTTMFKKAKDFRADARASLKGNWGGAVITTLVAGLISVVLAFIPFVGRILSILAMPISYGFCIAFLNNARSKAVGVKTETLFEGFSDYGRIFGTMLLRGVYVFLWSLLLIVPGIIKAYSYAMTEYILKDDPNLKYNGAIEKSMDMMRGYKWKLFCLHFSFIGWALLSILTLGIGHLWLAPYQSQSVAHFYLELKAEYESRTACEC